MRSRMPISRSVSTVRARLSRSVGRVGDRDDLRRGEALVPAAGVFDVRAVDAQHQFRAGRERGLDLGRVEAVDRDAEAVGLAAAAPRRRRRPTCAPGSQPRSITSAPLVAVAAAPRRGSRRATAAGSG